MSLRRIFTTLLFLALPLPALAETGGGVAAGHPESLGIARDLLSSFCEPECSGNPKTSYTETGDESFSMQAKEKVREAKPVRRKPAENQGLADNKTAPASNAPNMPQENAQD